VVLIVYVQAQLASSDIDWKLKYYFDHVLVHDDNDRNVLHGTRLKPVAPSPPLDAMRQLTVESEPRVVGLNVPWKHQAQETFCSPHSRSYYIEYSAEEPNVFHFITDPEVLSSRVLHPLCTYRRTHVAH
jgi:hypothetical protein